MLRARAIDPVAALGSVGSEARMRRRPVAPVLVLPVGALAVALWGETTWRAAAIVAASIGLAVLATRLTSWEALFAGYYGLLIASTSDLTLPGPLSQLRFLLGLPLLIWTVASYPRSIPLRGRPAMGAALLIALPLTAAASTIWSPTPATTLMQSAALGISVVLPLLMVSRRWPVIGHHRDLGLVGLYLGGFVVAGTPLAILEVARGDRASGLFHNPNGLGQAAALSILLTLAWPTSRAPVVSQFARAGSLMLQVALLVMSGSRTSLLAALVGSVFLRLRLGSTSRSLRLGRALVMCVPLLFALRLVGVDLAGPIRSVIGRLEEASTDDFSGRNIAWEFALDSWRDRPVLGHGYRSAGAVYSEWSGRSSNGPPEIDAVHNGYLQLLVELGLVGLTIFALAMYFVLGNTTLTRRHVSVVCAQAVVVTGLVMQIGESSVVGAGTYVPLTLFICCAVSLRNRAGWV